jgi:hypothetical protein
MAHGHRNTHEQIELPPIHNVLHDLEGVFWFERTRYPRFTVSGMGDFCASSHELKTNPFSSAMSTWTVKKTRERGSSGLGGCIEVPIRRILGTER